MKKIKIECLIAVITVLVINLTVKSAPNIDIVDPNFNPQIQTLTFQSKSVGHLLTQSDGKILAVGIFNNYNGQPVGSVVRLNADASLDTTFNSFSIESVGFLSSVLLQTDGKIVLQGNITILGGTNNPKAFIRLNADGTLDSTFNYTYGGSINQVIVDSSGRLMVWGNIQVNVNGTIVSKAFIRLNDDGTIDTSFNAQLQPVVIRMFTQNNKIIYVIHVLATQQYQFYRLNEDGSNDTSFSPPEIGLPSIVRIKTLTDNKILMLTSGKVVRFNENGTVDTGFQQTALNFAPNYNPRHLLLQSDGKIIITYSVPSGTRIDRLLPDGSLDTSFMQYNYSGSSGAGVTVQLDDSIIIGDEGSNSSSNNFTRLFPNGTVDTSFNQGGTGFQSIAAGKIRTITVLANDKILIGGDFDKVNNIDRKKIARLNPDSTLDSSFQINTNATGNYFSTVSDIYKITIQTDGKLIVSGNFNYFVNGLQKINLVRLNSDGSIDPTFNLSLNINDFFQSSLLGQNKSLQLTNGKILVGSTRNGPMDNMSVPLLLSAGGVKDSSLPTIFNTENLVVIFDVELLPDGKVLIVGKHESSAINQFVRKGFILRLNSNGTVDESFQATELDNGQIHTLTLLPNGQILIVSYTNNLSNIFRLNSDGSVDNSFNSGSGANGRINAIEVLPNNKIIIGGAFSTYNGQARQNLAILNADGTLDTTVVNVNSDVYCITVDNQGRVLIGGQFTTISTGGQNVANKSGGEQNSASTVSNTQATRSYLARLIISATETVRKTLFDFDGDGKSDISVFRPTGGFWYLLNSSSGFTGMQFGDTSDKLVPADYDGDGKTDVAVYRAGTWYLNRSLQGFTGIQFGASEDVPLPADFNGDGRAELVVWRPSTGIWYVYDLTSNIYTGFQFGASTDKPVIGDFDGDGKADYAVYRPSNGIWYVQQSANGLTGMQFGIAEDKPVAADYDGDGKTDIAVFRPSNGVWYIQRSQSGFTSMQFGISTDLPAPADYDGDGKADISVFRPSNGTWYLQQSESGTFTGMQFGTSTDLPVPNAFVP